MRGEAEIDYIDALIRAQEEHTTAVREAELQYMKAMEKAKQDYEEAMFRARENYMKAMGLHPKEESL
ncbi:MAG: hypothetical protein NO516_06250 [Candidatus Methanomethylicia archaeon]|nr:hypothetical protein [Candidatus Methanomethylicia archaeon]